jgi:hypothetical protein
VPGNVRDAGAARGRFIAVTTSIPVAFDRAVETGPMTEAEPKTDMDAVGDDGQVFGG